MSHFPRSIFVFLAFNFFSATQAAGTEGYWGRSEIMVRLSAPESVHSAPLELSPRYCEADTLPLESHELMDLGVQLSERTSSLGALLGHRDDKTNEQVLDAYVRTNLRCFGGDYEPGMAKAFRVPGQAGSYIISPAYQEYQRGFFEKRMYDLDARRTLRKTADGIEISQGDADADRALLARKLPKPFALHLSLIEGQEVTFDALRSAIKECEAGPEHGGVIVNYLRYNLARRLLFGDLPHLPGRNLADAEAELTEAKRLLETVRLGQERSWHVMGNNSLRTAALHKLADVEFARFRLAAKTSASLPLLEASLRLLRLCKEEGDPTAVGSIQNIVREFARDMYRYPHAELAALPEIRRSLAIYLPHDKAGSRANTNPFAVRDTMAWITSLKNAGVCNDPAMVRMAARLHDAGLMDACAQALELCPQGDGIVQLIRAHLACQKHDYLSARKHLAMAEADLEEKSRRHLSIISRHFEYGLDNETEMMYGRVLVEHANILLYEGDFLGAARKLRRTRMDLFNADYVQSCLLTSAELKVLADEEPSVGHEGFEPTWEPGEIGDPMARRDPPSVYFGDFIDDTVRPSARVTLARRLLQEGRARESLPYWNKASQTNARRYADLMDVARDTKKPQRERGLAYWNAGLILRDDPNLWACSGGYELEEGEFTPRLAMSNREASRDPWVIGVAEHARIEASKAWTARRNSFFRYGLAEHCQNASELLAGEQSAYALWFGALALAYLDRPAAEPMRQKLLDAHRSTKIGRQALAVKGLPRRVDAPEMK